MRNSPFTFPLLLFCLQLLGADGGSAPTSHPPFTTSPAEEWARLFGAADSSGHDYGVNIALHKTPLQTAAALRAETASRLLTGGVEMKEGVEVRRLRPTLGRQEEDQRRRHRLLYSQAHLLTLDLSSPPSRATQTSVTNRNNSTL